MSAADEVKRAWTDKGAHPEYHRMSQRQLHQQWPVLAQAIEKLVRETPSSVGLTEEPRSIGPKPKLSNGAPIMQHHPSAGQVYLAADGTGWWRAEVMPGEDTRPPTREQIAETRDRIAKALWELDMALPWTPNPQWQAQYFERADTVLRVLALIQNGADHD